MSDFHGDLLIGGARLKLLHVELSEERRSFGSRECRLGGQLHLSPQEWETVRTDRPYRLELDDGRAGQVVITRVVSQSDREVVVDFKHLTRRAKSTVS